MFAMMTGGSVITESLGFDKDARQAEICAKSKADILSFPLFLASQQVLPPEYVTNITVTNIWVAQGASKPSQWVHARSQAHWV